MAKMKTVWGIDIGQCALKAIKLRGDGESPPEIEAYEVVEHAGVLSQPDVDANVLIQASLDEFLRRVDLGGASVAVSVFGQSIMRFVKLPPVEAKRIPDIVRFEAEQQIPFPLKEMVWRYQTFYEADSPDIEAGLFAMKKIDVAMMLSYFVRAGIEVDLVQMAPLSLFNFMQADAQSATDGATVLADIGADKTHLVISDGGRVWTRTIQIGGNNFTEALVRSFKLNFEKAEQQKRNATSSKYARHIFQAMRPVFAELVQEIQRSLGYYSSLHREVRFTQLIGMGNGFLLPGMKKYLEQNLNMPVRQVKKFNKVICNVEGIGKNLLGLGVAYGLAAQSLGFAPLMTNMLPHAVVTQRLWKKKTPFFAAAAAMVVVAALLFPLNGMSDISKLKKYPESLSEAQQIVRKLDKWNAEGRKIETDHSATIRGIDNHLSMRKYATIVPMITSTVNDAFVRSTMSESDARILKTFARVTPAEQANLAGQLRSTQAKLEVVGMLPYAVEDPKDPGKLSTNPLRKTLLESMKLIPRGNRQILTVDDIDTVWVADLTKVNLSGTDSSATTTPGMMDMMDPTGEEPQDETQAAPPMAVGGYVVSITFRTPMAPREAVQTIGKFRRDVEARLKSNVYLGILGQPYVAPLRDRMALRGGFGGITPVGPGQTTVVKNPDPMFPKESMDKDERYIVRIAVAVLGDGISKPRTLPKPSTPSPVTP